MQKINFRGDSLSRLALGTVQLGVDYGIANRDGKPSIDEACKLLKVAQEMGIDTFDTAKAYGDSEKVLGECIGGRGNFITKISSLDFENSLKESIDSSKESLKTDRLFAVLLHDADILDRFDNSHSKEIDKFRDSFKYFGVSIYEDIEFKKSIKIDDISLIQIPFNILDIRAIRDGWIDIAKEKNILLFIRSVYLQGLFFMDIDNLPKHLKEAKETLKRLTMIADNLNLTLAQLSMSFVKSCTNDSIILFGAETNQQVEQNISDFDKLPILSREIIDDILAISSDIDEDIYNPSKWRLNE